MLELMGLGVISGSLVSISLGFIFFMLIETGISSGWRACFFLILGVLLGDAILLGIALFYSQMLAQTLQEYGAWLHVLAGLMFVGMGLVQLWHPRSASARSNQGLTTGLWQAFWVNLGNPSNWTFWLVLYSAPPVSVADGSGQLVFGLSALFSIVLCSSLVALVAAKTGKYLPEKSVSRINQAVSVGMIAVGLYWLFFVG